MRPFIELMILTVALPCLICWLIWGHLEDPTDWEFIAGGLISLIGLWIVVARHS